ncbi:MAG: GNAT family N-acetyltransferase [Deltaproteobacteria bacterium]|nr:GNAT family N-acetyltransferase [Deltaproteobacteria bacterium]
MENANELFFLMSDSDLTRFLTWEPHKSIKTTKTLIQNLIEAQQDDKGYHWCVCFNNKIIGLVSLIDVKRKIRTWTLNRAELSYWIGIHFQGKGYATEACKKIIDFGFSSLDFHKIVVAHAVENTESKNICTKLFFSKYAYEHDAFQKNDKWHDLIWYELIKEHRNESQ